MERLSSTGRWTQEESDFLLRACSELGPDRKWIDVSSWLAERGVNRGATQCRHRAQVLNGRGVTGERRKGVWLPEEDRLLVSAVKKAREEATDPTAPLEWRVVAQQVEGRNGKACRERWTSRLDPAIDRSPIRPEEEALLIRLRAQGACSWSSIAQELPGRTPDWVKCKFVSLQRREKAAKKAQELAPIPKPTPKRKEQPESRQSDCAPECLSKVLREVNDDVQLNTKKSAPPNRGLARQPGSRSLGSSLDCTGKGRGVLHRLNSPDVDLEQMLARLSSISGRLSTMSGTDDHDETDVSTRKTSSCSVAAAADNDQMEINQVLCILESVDTNVRHVGDAKKMLSAKMPIDGKASPFSLHTDSDPFGSTRSLCSLLGDLSPRRSALPKDDSFTNIFGGNGRAVIEREDSFSNLLDEHLPLPGGNQTEP